MAYNQVYGTSRNDFLYGSNGEDHFHGRSGNDTIYVWGGNDILDGGLGFDRASFLYATSGVGADLSARSASLDGDTIHLSSIEALEGSNYVDFLRGNHLANNLFGRGGSDVIYGEGGDDFISAGPGDDTIYGGDGNDTMRGDTGDDTFYVSDGMDWMRGESGTDTADYRAAIRGVEVDLHNESATDHHDFIDTLTSIENIKGSSHNDDIRGDAAGNLILGFNGRDTLDGYSGNDSLHGGFGNDILDGGRGNDVLYGEWGADLFVFRASNIDGKASAPFDAGLDLIADFDYAEGDRIDLRDHFAVDSWGDIIEGARQRSGYVAIELENGDEIRLLTMELGDLHSGMFFI